MMFESLLSQYGYLALFLGCLLEGETLLVLAGMAAHGGYLSYPVVVTVAFVGGATGDLIGFQIGRRFGPALFVRWPRFRSAADRVLHLIEQHATSCIVGVRFMYGLRLVGPVAIGTSSVTATRFAFFNAVGAALWAVLVSGVGFLFGHAIDGVRSGLALFESMALVVAIAIGAWVVYRVKGRR